jgi:ribonuclease P protein component
VQRKFRLTRSEDFKRVRRSGRSYAHPLVILIVLKSEKNEQGNVRVGVTAGRTTGTAVRRNRAKRMLREAMRTLLPNIVLRQAQDSASHADLILIARSGLTSATFDETRQALLDLLQRAQLLSSPVHDS